MHVHQLDNLEFEAPPGKRLVVLGDPIAHSLSPAMHNAALERMADKTPEFRDWKYEAVHVPASDLAKALTRLHQERVMGINLTIPHKVDVIGMIGDIDETARAMGAVNTLKWAENGYSGTNTDGYGIQKAVAEAFGCELQGQDIWIFGAGGAARGIAVACLKGGCRRLTVVNRSEPRLRDLKQQFQRQDLEDARRMRFSLLNEAPRDPDHEALLINATSLGLKQSDPNPIGQEYLSQGKRVYDTTYGIHNRLAQDCGAKGVSYADGLSMLVWQGALSLEIWTEEAVPADVMHTAALECLKERKSNG
jgi:shikimate dehydrogenase